MAPDDGRVQADFAANVLTGSDIVLNSDGTAVRTYTYVADAITGLFYVLLRGEQMAYNVADPHGLVSIRHLAELFTQVRGRRLAGRRGCGKLTSWEERPRRRP